MALWNRPRLAPANPRGTGTIDETVHERHAGHRSDGPVLICTGIHRDLPPAEGVGIHGRILSIGEKGQLGEAWCRRLDSDFTSRDTTVHSLLGHSLCDIPSIVEDLNFEVGLPPVFRRLAVPSVSGSETSTFRYESR